MIVRYIATVHLLIELDDSVPGMCNSQAAACDAVAEHLRNCQPEIKDWGYANSYHPVEVNVPDDCEEGEFLEYIR